jgi:NADH-quinone oxidoreductase subunit M
VFAPLIVLTIWMGVYPVSFTRPMHASVVNLVTKYETASVPRPSAVTLARR